jgi:ABC-type sulfate transport system permease component
MVSAIYALTINTADTWPLILLAETQITNSFTSRTIPRGFSEISAELSQESGTEKGA